MSRTTRLFKLMDALRGHRRPVTAARLADDLSVSVRTVYRDIQTLIDLGAPLEGEAGIGYLLRAGFFLPPLMFGEEELEALVLGARWVQGQGDTALAQAAASALAKIATASPKDLRDKMADTGLWAPRFQTPAEHPAGPAHHPRGYAARAQAVGHLRGRDGGYHGKGACGPSHWLFSRVSACWRPGVSCATAFATSARIGSPRSPALRLRYPTRRAALVKTWRRGAELSPS